MNTFVTLSKTSLFYHKKEYHVLDHRYISTNKI